MFLAKKDAISRDVFFAITSKRKISKFSKSPFLEINRDVIPRSINKYDPV